jgi:hypothetical protein
MGGKGGQCVGLSTLPSSCADCLKIWEPQPPGALRACNGIALPYKKRESFVLDNTREEGNSYGFNVSFVYSLSPE